MNRMKIAVLFLFVSMTIACSSGCTKQQEQQLESKAKIAVGEAVNQVKREVNKGNTLTKEQAIDVIKAYQDNNIDKVIEILLPNIKKERTDDCSKSLANELVSLKERKMKECVDDSFKILKERVSGLNEARDKPAKLLITKSGTFTYLESKREPDSDSFVTKHYFKSVFKNKADAGYCDTLNSGSQPVSEGILEFSKRDDGSFMGDFGVSIRFREDTVKFFQ